MHVLFFDRMQFVPHRKPASDDYSDENADQKKPAIRRQHDQQNGDYYNGDDQTRRPFEAESKPAAKYECHSLILMQRRQG